MVVAAVLAATNLRSRSGPESMEEKRDMITSEQVKRSIAVPPIDAMGPDRTQTATFALG